METRYPTLPAVMTFTLMICGTVSASTPPVSDLLDGYAKTLDATQSFIDFYEQSGEYSYNLPAASVSVRGAKRYVRGQHRADGRRTYWQCYSWGDVNPQLRNLPESTPRYSLRVEAKGNVYSHSKAVNNPQAENSVSRFPMQTDKAVLSRRNYSGLYGYLGAEERLDTVLRQADPISVRPTTETIGGSACYVIEAHTKYGDYTVWLDPEHGCQPAKAIRKATGGQEDNGRVIPGGDSEVVSVDHVRFEQIDGVWVPVEADQNNEYTSGNSQLFSQEKVHTKRTKITLNPDHDKLGSFVDPLENPAQDPELENGTRVFLWPVGTVRYKWLNGRVVPDVDGIVLDELDKMMDELRKKDRATLGDPNKDMTEQGLSALDLLDRYARTQHRLRSLIVEAENAIKSLSGQRQQVESSRSSFRTDGLRVRHCESSWGLGKTTESAPAYHSFLYAGTELIEYSKPSTWDKGCVMVGRNSFRAKTLVSLDYRGAPLLGICPGDTQRVDHVVKRAKDLFLAGAPEVVGGMPCHVVEARTECGRYKLWIDPKHDYHLAKLELERRAGDKVDATELSGKPMVFSMSNVRFQQIENLWVPVEADLQMMLGNRDTTYTWHHKRTRVTLEPDHTALNSFVADDIPDGTEVKRAGERTIRFVWRKGEVVTEANQNVAR
jgi:hypothetical protein